MLIILTYRSFGHFLFNYQLTLDQMLPAANQKVYLSCLYYLILQIPIRLNLPAYAGLCSDGVPPTLTLSLTKARCFRQCRRDGGATSKANSSYTPIIPNGYDNSWQGGASTHLLLAEPIVTSASILEQNGHSQLG